MIATDPSFLFDLAFGCLPALVGLVGLCLVGRFPRPRGVAVAGLILLTIAPLLNVLRHTVLDRLLWEVGLPLESGILVSYLGPGLFAVALLLLAVAATRRPQEASVRPGSPGGRGAPSGTAPQDFPGGAAHPPHGPYGGA